MKKQNEIGNNCATRDWENRRKPKTLYGLQKRPFAVLRLGNEVISLQPFLTLNHPDTTLFPYKIHEHQRSSDRGF